MSAPVETSTAALTAQLKGFQAQLAEVNALVVDDPLNPEFAEIQRSLIEGISFVSNLIKESQGLAGTADLAKAVTEFEQVSVDRKKVDLIDGVAPPASGEFDAGCRVEARVATADSSGNLYWYPGVIQSVDKDERKFTVRLIGKGEVVVVDFEECRRSAMSGGSSFKSIPATEIRPGTKVMAKYHRDSKCYPARVDEVVPGGWKVTYLSYGNTDIVPYEYIRAMPKTEEAAAAEDFVVPENMKILETDTDAEKKRKKKAIKALKNNHRLFVIEKGHADKKSSWMQFQNKAAKKKTVAALNPLKRESIFKTPEAYDSKVGVVGSGLGMTDFEGKKRARKS